MRNGKYEENFKIYDALIWGKIWKEFLDFMSSENIIVNRYLDPFRQTWQNCVGIIHKNQFLTKIDMWERYQFGQNMVYLLDWTKIQIWGNCLLWIMSVIFNLFRLWKYLYCPVYQGFCSNSWKILWKFQNHKKRENFKRFLL